MDRFAGLFAVCFASATAAPAHAVSIGDREWRQVSETLAVSWNQLSSIYDETTGHLDTSTTTIGNIDFAGWTWASDTEVEEMLQATGLGIPACGPPCNVVHEEINSTWAPAAIDYDGDGPDTGLFAATAVVIDPNTGLSFLHWVNGLSRTLTPAGLISAPFFSDIESDLLPDYRRDSFVSPTLSVDFLGVWLYRDAARQAVPLSSTFTLVVLGLLGIRVHSSNESARS